MAETRPECQAGNQPISAGGRITSSKPTVLDAVSGSADFRTTFRWCKRGIPLRLPHCYSSSWLFPGDLSCFLLPISNERRLHRQLSEVSMISQIMRLYSLPPLWAGSESAVERGRAVNWLMAQIAALGRLNSVVCWSVQKTGGFYDATTGDNCCNLGGGIACHGRGDAGQQVPGELVWSLLRPPLPCDPIRGRTGLLCAGELSTMCASDLSAVRTGDLSAPRTANLSALRAGRLQTGCRSRGRRACGGSPERGAPQGSRSPAG